jgi:predicted RNA polymerase sigma factor
MVHGANVGLKELSNAESDPTLTGHYRVCAVRAHLLEMAGDREGALVQYRRAARLTLSVPERRYLKERATRLARSGGSTPKGRGAKDQR